MICPNWHIKGIHKEYIKLVEINENMQKGYIKEENINDS